MLLRFKSRADFAKDDLRQLLPRFSDENFPKNLELVDKFHAVAHKYDANPAQVALAWILAEHSDSECPSSHIPYLSSLCHHVPFLLNSPPTQ